MRQTKDLMDLPMNLPMDLPIDLMDLESSDIVSQFFSQEYLIFLGAYKIEQAQKQIVNKRLYWLILKRPSLLESHSIALRYSLLVTKKPSSSTASHTASESSPQSIRNCHLKSILFQSGKVSQIVHSIH